MSTPHSPLGGSAAEIFTQCDGYATVLEAMKISGAGEDDNASEFSIEGSCAHEVAAKCLNEGMDPWELVGETFYGVEVTPEMTDAVAVHVNECRRLARAANAQVHVEHSQRAPLPGNPWQTADHVVITDSMLCLTDYKHGQGKFVEIMNCAQLMFYSYRYILDNPGIRRVVLRIIQPRISHPDGPIRRWETTSEYICQWVNDTLIPAMRRNYAGGCFKPGAHCQFCPGKLVCPALSGMFEVAMRSDTKALPYLASDHLARNYQFVDQVRSYCSAIEKELHSRMQKGQAVPGYKLVQAQGNRVFKDGAEFEIEMELGDAAYEKREMLSPAKIEKLNAKAAELVKKHAYRPDKGLTVAPESDKRPEVKVQSAAEVFGAAIEALQE